MKAVVAFLGAFLLVPAALSAQVPEETWTKLKVHHQKLVGEQRCSCGVKAGVHKPALSADKACFCGEAAWSGSRIEVTLRNGNTVKGFLVDPQHDSHSKVKPRNLDFTKEKSVTVDLTLEYTRLNGTITFNKTDIKNLRILEALDEATLRRLEEEKEKHRDAIEKLGEEHDKRMKDLAAKDKEAEARAAKEEEDARKLKGEEDKLKKLQEAKEFYARFPSPEWGPEKKKELEEKVRRFKTDPTALRPTAEEQEFLANYALWESVHKLINAEEEERKKKEEEEERKKEEEEKKKKEETPK